MAEYCKDTFEFYDDADDSFRMWQGLVGPNYTPIISNDGTLRWSNNGLLPNPGEVNLRGPQGAGLQIGGITEELSGLPAEADPGTIWLVGTEAPYEGYSYINGTWIELGPLTVGPAGPPGPKGDDYTLTETDKNEIAAATESLLLINLSTNPLPIGAGGTGAGDLNGAQDALGIKALQEKVGSSPLSTEAQNLSDAVNELADAVVPSVLPIQRGGTGADDLEGAQENLGITDLQTITGDGTLSGFTATDLTEAANELKEGLDNADRIIGDGNLSGFASTDLTGAVNTLKADLNHVVLRATAAQTISGNGTTNSIALTGLTADHVVGNWGMFSDAACTTPIPENSPTCDITITTAANAWSVTIENFSSTFYLRPTFILKQN